MDITNAALLGTAAALIVTSGVLFRRWRMAESRDEATLRDAGSSDYDRQPDQGLRVGIAAEPIQRGDVVSIIMGGPDDQRVEKATPLTPPELIAPRYSVSIKPWRDGLFYLRDAWVGQPDAWKTEHRTGYTRRSSALRAARRLNAKAAK